jgi:hypothetical protein
MPKRAASSSVGILISQTQSKLRKNDEDAKNFVGWGILDHSNNSCEGDRLLHAMGDTEPERYGQGRAAAFTPDAAPHGAPPQFLEWEYFPRIWQQLVGWLTESSIPKQAIH